MKGDSTVLTAPASQQEAASVTQEITTAGKIKPVAERKRPGRLSEDKRFKIFAGSANRKLAEGICTHVGVQLGESKLQRFADGEIYFQLLENVRGGRRFYRAANLFPGGSAFGGIADHD